VSPAVTCDDVLPLLPELAEGGLRTAGPIEAHLESCASCSAELGRYRAVLQELGALSQVVVEPSAQFLAGLLAQMPEARRRAFLYRMAADERVQHAALSLGGAIVGATAIGLLWWRVTRRSLLTGGVAVQEAGDSA
jgi:hypothetical protein